MLKNLFAAENLLNLLLIFVPVAAVLEFTHGNAIAIFVTSVLAIIPWRAGWAVRLSIWLKSWGKGWAVY